MPREREERTEPATPRRRSEARQRGQVAKSHDLVTAVLLLTGFLTVGFFGPMLWGRFLDIMKTALDASEPVDMSESVTLAGLMLGRIALPLLPILIILFLVTALVLYAQVGPLWTLQPLTPSLSKLNPINGLRRLFSLSSVMSLLMNVAKVGVVAAVTYAVMVGAATPVLLAFTLQHGDILLIGSQLAFRMGVTLSVVLVALAIVDYVWQRRRYDQSLRMTKEEVKDELRSMEGDPAVKRRRRQLQLQMMAQRLRKEVPQADVIITNPTHYAVAIRYDSDSMIAPKVIAKGADELALRIRLIANEFRIPIVERRALACSLYESVDVGQFVPERFYKAIAEILAYVYELSGAPRLWRQAQQLYDFADDRSSQIGR